MKEKFRFKDEMADGTPGTPLTAKPFNDMLERIEKLERYQLFQWFLFVVIIGFLMLTGCSSEKSTRMVCEPREVRNCPCLGGDDGVQECFSDGSGWDYCTCGDADADNDTDTDTDVDRDTGSDVDTDADGDTDSDTGAVSVGSETDDTTGTGGDGDTDTDMDGDMDTDSDTDADTDGGGCGLEILETFDSEIPTNWRVTPSGGGVEEEKTWHHTTVEEVGSLAGEGMEGGYLFVGGYAGMNEVLVTDYYDVGDCESISVMFSHDFDDMSTNDDDRGELWVIVDNSVAEDPIAIFDEDGPGEEDIDLTEHVKDAAFFHLQFTFVDNSQGNYGWSIDNFELIGAVEMNGDADTGTDADMETDADTDIDTDGETESDSDTATDSATGPETSTDSESRIDEPSDTDIQDTAISCAGSGRCISQFETCDGTIDSDGVCEGDYVCCISPDDMRCSGECINLNFHTCDGTIDSNGTCDGINEVCCIPEG